MQNSGHLRLCQQPRAAHALRSDQNLSTTRPEMLQTDISSRNCPMREDPDPPAQPLTNITTVTSKTRNISLLLICLCLGNQVDMSVNKYNKIPLQGGHLKLRFIICLL